MELELLFTAKIIFIFQKYLFSGYSKKWHIKQSDPDLNRGLSSNLWWLRSANHVKFTQEYNMCIKKHVLVKNLYKWAKFATTNLSEKDSLWIGLVLCHINHCRLFYAKSSLYIEIYMICKHKSTKLNGSKYCYVSLTIQLNINHLFTHS